MENGASPAIRRLWHRVPSESYWRSDSFVSLYEADCRAHASRLNDFEFTSLSQYYSYYLYYHHQFGMLVYFLMRAEPGTAIRCYFPTFSPKEI